MSFRNYVYKDTSFIIIVVPSSVRHLIIVPVQGSACVAPNVYVLPLFLILLDFRNITDNMTYHISPQSMLK